MWDQRYSAAEFIYGTEPNDFLESVAHQLAAGKTLCLAEGEGRNAVYLAGMGHQVMAVDSSVVGLEKAQRLAKERGVELDTLAVNLADYEIEPENWDCVVSIFCHLPVDIRRRLHRKVVAGLRPGGVLVLEAYTPRQLEHGTGGPPAADLMMNLSDLQDELQGLVLQHALETEREVIEGKLHTGMGAVVQVLAVKPG